MDDYLITRWVSGSKGEISIDANHFERIRVAKQGIIMMIDLEERLALVLTNFVEFESALFVHGLRWELHQDWRWASRRDEALRLSRQLLNLLNSILMYQDQVDRQFKRCRFISKKDRDEIYAKVQENLSTKALMAMKILRNYCQHQGLGVQGAGIERGSCQIYGRGSFSESDYTATHLSVDVAELSVRGNDPLGEAVLQSLRESGDTWDPAYDIRQAIDDVTRGHGQLRDSLATHLGEWQKEMDSVFEMARKEFDQCTGLCALERQGRGIFRNRIEIFPELLKRMESLRLGNGSRTQVAGRLITTGRLFGHN